MEPKNRERTNQLLAREIILATILFSTPIHISHSAGENELLLSHTYIHLKALIWRDETHLTEGGRVYHIIISSVSSHVYTFLSLSLSFALFHKLKVFSALSESYKKHIKADPNQQCVSLPPLRQMTRFCIKGNVYLSQTHLHSITNI